MIPAPFDYKAPTTIPEAIALLQQNEGAKVLSGGHSLIPLLRFRLAEPSLVVDINRIPGLDYIREEDGWLRIGALVREADLEESALVHERYPLLYETSCFVADPLVRNMATLAGNLAHADPANDHPAAMVAYRAEVVATGPTGDRIIPIDDFFPDFFTSALEPDEILTEVRIPVPAARSGGAYFKLERKVGDYGTAGVATQVSLAEDGTIREVGIGLTNVGPTVLRARRSEDLLRGSLPSDDLIVEAGRLAAEDSEPTEDLRGSEEYKRNLVRVLTIRALNKALERARG